MLPENLEPCGLKDIVKRYAMTGPVLVNISPGSIDVGEIPFDLYVPGSFGKLREFCKKNSTVTVQMKLNLEEKVKPLYIQKSDLRLYLDYVYGRLGSIISNPRIRVNDKSNLLYFIGKRTVSRLYSKPYDDATIEEARDVIRFLVDGFLLNYELGKNLFIISSMDFYKYSHAVNVMVFNLMLGYKIFGSSRIDLQRIALAGLLHDIGKAEIDKKIIDKPAALTESEFETAREHVRFSYKILSHHGLDEEIQLAGRYHHERLDGSGYPDGLSGDKVPLFARITAISDIYDAITSTKAYQEARPNMIALSEMSEMGGKIDEDIFDKLLETVFQNDDLVASFKEDKEKYLADLKAEEEGGISFNDVISTSEDKQDDEADD